MHMALFSTMLIPGLHASVVIPVMVSAEPVRLYKRGAALLQLPYKIFYEYVCVCGYWLDDHRRVILGLDHQAR